MYSSNGERNSWRGGGGGLNTEYTEWQRQLSGVHPITMEKLAQASARPPPFTIPTIMYKVVVYAGAERADTLPLHFYSTLICSLWGGKVF